MDWAYRLLEKVNPTMLCRFLNFSSQAKFAPNPLVKRDCGTGVARFLGRLSAAAPYLQR